MKNLIQLRNFFLFMLIVACTYREPYALSLAFLVFMAAEYMNGKVQTEDSIKMQIAIDLVAKELKNQKELLDKVSSKVFIKDLMR